MEFDAELNRLKYAELEALFLKYQINIYICGHVHTYQRTFPVDKNNLNSIKTNEYNIKIDKIKSPIYITSGGGGTYHHISHSKIPPENFIAKTFDELSISEFEVKSKDKIMFRQINVENGQIVDEFVLETG